MSEFKFACPICGQHISADSHGTGSQLECPTCYRKIVVPQAPASADPKFILAATEANKPRPPQPSLPPLEPISRKPGRSAVSLTVIIILIALGLAGAAAVVYWKMFSGDKKNAGPPAGESNAVPALVITNDIAWNLDLARAVYPDADPAGTLRGEVVTCNRSTLTGGAFNFRQAGRGPAELSVTIQFYTRHPEELRGKTVNITTNAIPTPRVVLRWKEGKEGRSQVFTNGYALKMELGEIVSNHMTGKIYLSLPDEAQSHIAGSFSAEIRIPPPARPRPPRSPTGS